MPQLDAPVGRVLDELYEAARGDWRFFPRVLPYYLLSRVTGRNIMQLLKPVMAKDIYLPVSREAGGLLYALARGTEAKRIVEYGASFGISTLYLAAAARDTGGRVISTEIEPTKY